MEPASLLRRPRAAMILGVALLRQAQPLKQTTLKQQLVGTWTFVRTEATQADRSKSCRSAPTRSRVVTVRPQPEDGRCAPSLEDRQPVRAESKHRVGRYPQVRTGQPS